MTKIDPRFRRHARKTTKVVVDQRFSGMFTDPEFTGAVAVDKYGRTRHDGTGADELRRYYALEKGDRGDVASEKDDSSDGGAAKATHSDDQSVGDDQNLSDDPSVNDSDDSGDSDDTGDNDAKCIADDNGDADLSDEARQRLIDAGIDSPFSEEEEEDDGGLDEALSSHPLVATENTPVVSSATRRLALVNADWDTVRAVDVYTMLHAFLPPGGAIRHVAVHLSDFGRARMHAERTSGPAVSLGAEAPAEEEAAASDDDCHTPQARALRKYQLERLRYHYAVVECDAPATAQTLYAQCDGAEFETSAVFVDLRFVPDDAELPALAEAADVCTSLPRTYHARHGASSAALQLTRPTLAWDGDDPRRAEAAQRAFAPGALSDDDVRALVASASESEDEGGADGRRARYRALLTGGADAFGRKGVAEGAESDSAPDSGCDMEATFVVDAAPAAPKKRSAKAMARKALRQRKTAAGGDADRLALLVREDDGEDEDVVHRSRVGGLTGVAGDSRFSSLHGDASFARDPTHPLYRRTPK